MILGRQYSLTMFGSMGCDMTVKKLILEITLLCMLHRSELSE